MTILKDVEKRSTLVTVCVFGSYRRAESFTAAHYSLCVEPGRHVPRTDSDFIGRRMPLCNW